MNYLKFYLTGLCLTAFTLTQYLGLPLLFVCAYYREVGYGVTVGVFIVAELCARRYKRNFRNYLNSVSHNL